MRECWENLLTFFRIEMRGGAYLALAFAAALYLAGVKIAAHKDPYVSAKDKKNPKREGLRREKSRRYTKDAAGKRGDGPWHAFFVPAVWILLLMNPLTALLFEKLTGRVYRYGFAVLAVPILPLIAYAAADILRRQKRQMFPVALMLAVSLAFAGTVLPYQKTDAAVRRSAEWDEEESGAMDTVLFRAAQMRESGQVPLLVAPKRMMDAVRRYDAGIVLAYGRDLWQTGALPGVNDIYSGEQVLLCQAMEAEPLLTVETAELALAYGCNLIVLKAPLDTDFLDNSGLSCVYESERFFVYTR